MHKLFASIATCLISGVVLIMVSRLASAAPAVEIIVNPGESIQTAIDGAPDGATILVNAGLYTESLTLNRPISLTGVNSATTIIHAVSSQPVLSITGAVISNNVIISGLTFTGANRGSNAGGGISVIGNAQPLLDSVIITNNLARYGAGLYAALGSPLTIVNSLVVSNAAVTSGGGDGGGVYVHAPITVINSRFEQNLALGEGGGLYTNNDLMLTRTQFISNTGFNGGGALSHGAVVVFDSLFERNSTIPGGGYGGGLYATYPLFIDNSTFISNSAVAEGGGARSASGITVFNSHFENNICRAVSSYPCVGGGLQTYGSLTVSNTKFISNATVSTSSPQGGGLHAGTPANIFGSYFERNHCIGGSRCEGGGIYAGQAHITSSSFISNTSSDNGGAMLVPSLISVVDSAFVNNSAVNDGGGILIYGTLYVSKTAFISNTSGGNGGAISHPWIVGRLDVANGLFAHNHSTGNGSAIYSESFDPMELLHVTIADSGPNLGTAIVISSGSLALNNSIIANHTIAIENIGGTVSEDYNNFFDNTTEFSGTITSGANSLFGLDADPLFADPPNDNYHLTEGSAALDNALDLGILIDLDSNPRPQNGTPDRGAYEGTVIITEPVFYIYLPLVRRN